MAVLIAWLGGALWACTRVESPDSPPGVSLEGGFGGEAEGGSSSLAGMGLGGAGDETPSFGGAPSSIDVGLWPTFAASPDQPSDAAAVLAGVAALSAGSGTLPVYARWDALSGGAGSPRVQEWALLDALVGPYRERGKDLALCVGIVDRLEPAWPFSQALDSQEAVAALERTIDEVFARYAPQLSHLCFGYEVDRYLSEASASDGQLLVAFLRRAVDYAARLASRSPRSPRTALGVALSLDAVARGVDLERLALGDEVVAVYDPLDASANLKPAGSVADELAAALAALPSAGGETMPLTLFEAGYPSAAAAGSSETEQRRYYQALFAALEARASAVTFVGLFGLGDRAAGDCREEAASFGGFVEERALVRCSMGLRAETGPKLAWPSVASALSRYR